MDNLRAVAQHYQRVGRRSYSAFGAGIEQTVRYFTYPHAFRKALPSVLLGCSISVNSSRDLASVGSRLVIPLRLHLEAVQMWLTAS